MGEKIDLNIVNEMPKDFKKGDAVPKKIKELHKAIGKKELKAKPKKYAGVTIGMAINNATNCVNAKIRADGEIFPPEEWAKSVVIHAICLLKEMERRGL